MRAPPQLLRFPESHPLLRTPFNGSPKYGCNGTVTACFALIAPVAWKLPGSMGLTTLSKLLCTQSSVEMARFQGRSLSLSGPVLRDTARLSQRNPPIARYGVFGVSTWPIGCDTPSPFSERFPLGEHAKWRCDIPPSKGVSQRYLRDTLRKQGKWVRYPPPRYYLERVLRDMGGYLGLGR